MIIQIQKVLEKSKFLAKFSSKKPQEEEAFRRIGLNVGRRNIVVCEVLFEHEKLLLERCARREILGNKPLTAQIKDLLVENRFQSKRVVTSLKGQGVVIRYVAFPKMSRLDFASSIQFEAEKYLPFNISEVVLDFHMIPDTLIRAGEDPATMPVILVAARKTEVDKLLSTVQSAGLSIDAIDVDTFACINAFEHANPEGKKHSIVLIDLGAVDTSLAVYDRGRIMFSRDIAFGGDDLREIIRRKLNISEEEAVKIQRDPNLNQLEHMEAVQGGLERLFQEIKSSLNYYYNQYQSAEPLETAYISGGFSQLSILPTLLEKHIELPVKKWNPIEQISLAEGLTPEGLAETIPYLPVCIGLAIRPK